MMGKIISNIASIAVELTSVYVRLVWQVDRKTVRVVTTSEKPGHTVTDAHDRSSLVRLCGRKATGSGRGHTLVFRASVCKL